MSKTHHNRRRPGRFSTTPPTEDDTRVPLLRRLAIVTLVAAAGTVAAFGLIALVLSPGRDEAPSQGPEPSSLVRSEQATSDFEYPPRPEFTLPEEASAIEQLASEVLTESFDVADRLVETFPDDPQAIHVLANLHQRHRNEAAAVRLWERCLELEPDFIDALMALGKLALTKGDYPAAEESLRQVWTREPDHPDAAQQLAEALINQGEFQQAVEVLEQFVSRNPAAAEPWSSLGHAYDQLEDPENARRCYLRALAIDADHMQANHGAAIALQKLGQAEEAAPYLERFQRLQSERSERVRRLGTEAPDEERLRTTRTNTFTSAGLVYARRGRAEMAEQHWAKAAEIDPEHVESRDLLVSLYMKQNRNEEALSICRELSETDPENPDVWSVIGVLSVKLRQLEEAATALRRAIELAPERPDNYAVLAQVQMPAERNPAEAVQLAEQAVELQPSAGHYYILATARWHTGDVSSAREALQRALQLEPTNAEYRQAYLQLQQEQ